MKRMIREFNPIATNETVVVVPCYNEADRLNFAQFTNFLLANPSVSIVFVNDGSTDKTAEVLSSIKKKCDCQVELLNLKQNLGKSGAVWNGLQLGFKKTPSYIAYWDADLATPLSEVLRFRETLKQLNHVQMLIGSRFPLMGHAIDRKRSRKILSSCFSTVSNLVMGIGARDTQCGAKMFRVTNAVRSILDVPFKSKWIFDVEILARIKNSKDFTDRCVFELGLVKWVEVNGSKIKLSDLFRFPWELINLAIEYRLRNHPRVIRDECVSTFETAQLPTGKIRKAA